MMAAITAARLGADVCLVERNPKLGRKLYITGKGRCNVTNHCTPEEVLAATPRNGKFLYSAMNQTPPAEVERFFTELGVELKVERGNRVFPVSDRSADIIDALFFELRRLSVPVIQGRVSALDVQDGAVCAVELRQDGEGQKKIPCRGVVLATGGPIPPPARRGTAMSWPGPRATAWYRPDPPWCRWRRRRDSAERCRAWP